MIQERVHAPTPQNPGSATLGREPVPGRMSLWRTEDLTTPVGFRLHVENVEPEIMVAAEMINDILVCQGDFYRIGVEPMFEVAIVDGAFHTLTIRAENGTWIWRFVDYLDQPDAYRLVWPD